MGTVPAVGCRDYGGVGLIWGEGFGVDCCRIDSFC